MMNSSSTRFLALVALLLVGMVAGRGNLVRGAHKPKGLKHMSMARMVDSMVIHQQDIGSRLLKKEDKNKDKWEDYEEEEVAAAEEAEEEEEEEDEEEATEAPDAEEEEEESTEAPDAGEEEVVEAVANETVAEDVVEAGNATETVEEEPYAIMKGEKFEVVLDPFTLTIDSAVEEDDLMLEEYLLSYMQEYLPNLVSIELTSETLEADDEEEEAADDANMTDTRNLRQASRSLESVTIYYEGVAKFEGPPKVDSAEVDKYLTQALEDQVAILAHLETTPLAGSNSTVTATVDAGDSKPTTVSVETEAEETPEQKDGLSTTGLSIVIVAACVGGISLLIILMVGLSGPSGSTSGIKGGLPEQAK